MVKLLYLKSFKEANSRSGAGFVRNAFSRAFIVNMSDFCDPHEVVMVLSLLLDLDVVAVEEVGVV